MANFIYNNAAFKIMDGTLNLSSDTLKVMLLESGYTPDRDHDFVDAASGSEAAGTGYTGGFGGAGRKTVASKTFNVDDTNDRGEMDCADITWTGLDLGTIVAAVIIKEITNDAASLLVGYIDSGFPKVTNGGDITLQINAEGLIHLITT
jgi:hypothetical protein